MFEYVFCVEIDLFVRYWNIFRLLIKNIKWVKEIIVELILYVYFYFYFLENIFNLLEDKEFDSDI